MKKTVNEFDNICYNRNLSFNVGKSKMMVFESENSEIMKFVDIYIERVRAPCQKQCMTKLIGQLKEEGKLFKYLSSILGKHGGRDKRGRVAKKERGKIIRAWDERKDREHGN